MKEASEFRTICTTLQRSFKAMMMIFLFFCVLLSDAVSICDSTSSMANE
jgi:hypothetical protein